MVLGLYSSPPTIDTTPETMDCVTSLRPPTREKGGVGKKSMDHGGSLYPMKNNDSRGLSSCVTQHYNTDTFSVAPTEESSDDETQPLSVRCLFGKANEYINPGCIFRKSMFLFAERKLMVFFLIHFASTMVVWFHFAYVKFNQKIIAVPEETTLYWWKVLAPSLEFGAMHAILLQMALIPLTMARYSISMAAGSVLDRFIPLRQTLRMHIHLGYTVVIIVFFASVLFFAFFGLLCRRGEQAFCNKFTSEIMCTGYGILTSLLIIAGTSHFRHKIPYELFYVIHHLVFVMYIITIAHTFDIEQRKNRADRSQTFKWFSATILYYVCDRTALHLNHKYRTRLVSSSSIAATNGANKMIVLNLQRPSLFRFRPGQHAYLRICKLDNQWHPFSIASDPSSSQLQFYVEVFSNTSWTGRLWSMLEQDVDCAFCYRQIDVDVMGPIGTPLAKIEDYSHTVAIGTGTGIVPILSLLKQQVHHLMRLDPKTHFQELEQYRSNVVAVESAEHYRRGSIFNTILNCLLQRGRRKKYIHLNEPKDELVKKSKEKGIAIYETSDEYRPTMMQMKKSAATARRSIYGTVFLCLFPVVGITLVLLMISWHTVQFTITDCMLDFLKYCTVGFHCCFAITAFFVRDATEFFTYIDVTLSLIAPFADWFWLLQCERNGSGKLNNGDLSLYSLFTGYMMFRFWSMAVVPRHRSWGTRVEKSGGIRTTERVHFVWITRSAALVSELLPDIDNIWKSLVDAWGETDAASVCRISVYVTDKDENSCRLLKGELRTTELNNSGAIQFGRPCLSDLIENHTIELVRSRRHSHTLLAYVGAPSLAQQIHHCKISNDIVTTITGHSRHQMDFVSDSYGGSKRRSSKESIPTSEAVLESVSRKSNVLSPAPDSSTNNDDQAALSIRHKTSYEEKA